MLLLTVYHLKYLHYISTINYYTHYNYQLPHWKNAASLTCPSRGGPANLHVV